MFGTNSIHGKKSFRGLAADELIVTSIFCSIQGEGPLSGERSVFVRLTHCSLNCYMCDSYFSSGDTYTFDNLLQSIRETINNWNIENNPTEVVDISSPNYSQLNSWNIIITGGEPLLQDNLFKFIDRCMFDRCASDDLFKRVQIESNGLSSIPSWEDKYALNDNVLLVVSPKCAEKGHVPTHYLKPNRRTLDRADCLKFVVTSDQNSPYSTIPDWAFTQRDIHGIPIYVSPMAEYLRYPDKYVEGENIELRNAAEKVSFWQPGLLDLAKIQANNEYAALLAMRHDCILSLQTHLYASLP